MNESERAPDAPGTTGGREPCPKCSRPVAMVTSVGPHEHYAAPCGCRVSSVFSRDFR